MFKNSILTSLLVFSFFIGVSGKVFADDFDWDDYYYAQPVQRYSIPKPPVYHHNNVPNMRKIYRDDDDDDYDYDDYYDDDYYVRPHVYNHPEYYRKRSNASTNTVNVVKYGAIGAMAGALMSNKNHGKNSLKGAAIGAAAGLLLNKNNNNIDY